MKGEESNMLVKEKNLLQTYFGFESFRPGQQEADRKSVV